MRIILKGILGFVGLLLFVACNSTPTSGATVRLMGVASNVGTQSFRVLGQTIEFGATGATFGNGSVVDVKGKHRNDGKIEATEISQDVEIKGSVSNIDLGNSTLVVLGQTIQADLNTVYEGSDASSLSLATLKIGDFVEVSGLRQADGTLLASRIELERGEKPNGMEVKGLVSSLDSALKTFMVGMQLVDYSGLTNINLVNGQRVYVKGVLNVSNILVATKINSGEQESPKPTSGDIEIEGLAGNVDTVSKTFVLRGFQVDYSSAVVVGTPVNGSRAEVEGTVLAVGTIKASKVEFKVKQFENNDADGKIKGVISAIDATAKTITVAGVIYSTDAATKFERNEQHIAFTDLKLSDKVEVRFVSSSLLARKIEVYIGELR